MKFKTLNIWIALLLVLAFAFLPTASSSLATPPPIHGQPERGGP